MTFYLTAIIKFELYFSNFSLKSVKSNIEMEKTEISLNTGVRSNKHNFAREMGLAVVFSCVLEKPRMLEAVLGRKINPRDYEIESPLYDRRKVCISR